MDSVWSVPWTIPFQVEDCLFLNVVSPRKIFEERKKKKHPVIIWIHGGGYVQGNKDAGYNPGGLIDRSKEDGSEGIVFVSINYRVRCELLPCSAPKLMKSAAWRTWLDRRTSLHSGRRTS
jgi:acetyl esterase/lipase